MKTISLCIKSSLFGVFIGILFTGSAWYHAELHKRGEITQAMLAQAKCDPGGFVSITFIDSSQFTCAPIQTLPPKSQAEANRRK